MCDTSIHKHLTFPCRHAPTGTKIWFGPVLRDTVRDPAVVGWGPAIDGHDQVVGRDGDVVHTQQEVDYDVVQPRAPKTSIYIVNFHHGCPTCR